MRNFCVVTNADKDPGLKVTQTVLDYLDNLCCSCELIDASGKSIPEKSLVMPEGCECCIVLGGDGTIIRTVRLMKDSIPVIGINLGNLGFLSSVERSDMFRAIDALVANDFTIENRMMIEAVVKGHEEQVFTTLNDVVVNRRGFSRMITTEVLVNDLKVNSYYGDGVIVSTPTGSTGYNLSAGGPIVTPQAELMLITPICSHSLSARSIVVSASDEITIKLDMNRLAVQDNAILTLDGQDSVELENGDSIVIRKSLRTAKLIKLKDKSFFKLLYMKLGEQN